MSLVDVAGSQVGLGAFSAEDMVQSLQGCRPLIPERTLDIKLEHEVEGHNHRGKAGISVQCH